jgi:hypothetical protein
MCNNHMILFLRTPPTTHSTAIAPTAVCAVAIPSIVPYLRVRTTTPHLATQTADGGCRHLACDNRGTAGSSAPAGGRQQRWRSADPHGRSGITSGKRWCNWTNNRRFCSHHGSCFYNAIRTGWTRVRAACGSIRAVSGSRRSLEAAFICLPYSHGLPEDPNCIRSQTLASSEMVREKDLQKGRSPCRGKHPRDCQGDQERRHIVGAVAGRRRGQTHLSAASTIDRGQKNIKVAPM